MKKKNVKNGDIMSTGFYRVFIKNVRGKKYFKYQIRNKLVRKEFIRKDIYELKKAVEEAGFLWGITDREEADKVKGQYNLRALQGKYGIQIGGKK